MIHRVHTLDQALAAADHGIDVLIAQGSEPVVRVSPRPEDCVRFETWSAIMPPSPGYPVVPRVIRTAFVDEWRAREAEAGEHAGELRAQIMGSIRAGRPEALTPFTGQTAGLVGEVLPAAEIVRRMAADACAALRGAAQRCD